MPVKIIFSGFGIRADDRQWASLHPLRERHRMMPNLPADQRLTIRFTAGALVIENNPSPAPSPRGRGGGMLLYPDRDQ